jgi:hypothetical protein
VWTHSCLAYSSSLTIEATYSSETSVDHQRPTQRYIPQDETLRVEKLKIHSTVLGLFHANISDGRSNFSRVPARLRIRLTKIFLTFSRMCYLIFLKNKVCSVRKRQALLSRRRCHMQFETTTGHSSSFVIYLSKLSVAQNM